jgi:arylsulfatase A-like enzyme
MRPMRRRAFITIAVALVVMGASSVPTAASRGSVATAAGTNRPNVVVVMADDMRYDDLDRVAALRPDGGFAWVRDHGTRFPRAWSTNNLCCPGRATFLTGQTSYNNTVFTNTPYIDPEDTLPRWMQDAGYCTGFTGKYMNAYTATKPRPEGWTFWEPLTARYADEIGYRIMRRDGKVVAPERFITDELTRVSRAQLRDCLDRDRPTFVAYFPYAPHFGSEPAPEYAGVDVPWSPPDPSFDEADVSDKPAWLQQAYPVPRSVSDITFGDRTLPAEGVAASATRLNVQSLLSVDDGLLALIDDLRAREQLDNTVFVLTSDNGYLFFEHRLSGKIVAYEAAQPGLWIAGPGFPADRSVDAFSTNLDVAPTIARAGGADTRVRRARWDGRTLQSVLAEPDLGHDRFLPIFVTDFAEGTDLQPEGHGVRTWRYKYIQYVDGTEELYDLSADPYELDNVALDPARADVKAAMTTLLLQGQECSGRSCRVSAPELLR